MEPVGFVVTADDREWFDRCRRAWDLGSRLRRNLERLGDDGPTLDRTMHTALAVYYFPGMWAWSRSIVEPLVERSLRDGGFPDSAFDFVRAYARWAETVDDFTPLRVETDLDVHVPDPTRPNAELGAPDGGAVHYRDRVDLFVVEETPDGESYWLVDHRVADGRELNPWAPADQLALDERALARMLGVGAHLPRARRRRAIQRGARLAAGVPAVADCILRRRESRCRAAVGDPGRGDAHRAGNRHRADAALGTLRALRLPAAVSRDEPRRGRDRATRRGLPPPSAGRARTGSPRRSELGHGPRRRTTHVRRVAPMRRPTTKCGGLGNARRVGRSRRLASLDVVTDSPVRVGALDRPSVRALQEWAVAIEAWPAGSHVWGHYAEQTERGPAICRTENVSACHDGVAGLVNGPLREVALPFLGDAIAFKDKLNYKQPGGAGFSAHQDRQAYPGVTDVLSVLVAIDECSLQSGCLWFAGDVDEPLAVDERGVIRDDVASSLAWRPAELAPGDAICISGLMPHYSEANGTGAPRRVLVASYAAADEGYTRARYYDARRAEMARASSADRRFRISTLADFEGVEVATATGVLERCTHG